MEPSPDFNLPFSPAPAPVNSKKTLWIGLGIGAVVLCLCLVVVVAGIIFGPQLLYSMNSVKYDNPDAGVSLSYPKDWVMQENGSGGVVLASSQDLLDNIEDTSIPGAAFVIVTDWNSVDYYDFDVNASTMDQVIEDFADTVFADSVDPQNMHKFKLSGLPAASAVYKGMLEYTSNEDPSAIYITAVLRQDTIVLLVGICPESEWGKQHATFDRILGSIKIYNP